MMLAMLAQCSALLIVVVSFQVVLAAENDTIEQLSTCENQLKSLQAKLEGCEQTLEVVYQLPEEMRKGWQTCRVSLLEEKQRAVISKLETLLATPTKVSSTPDNSTIAGAPTVTPEVGKHGRWVQTAKNEIPIDAFKSMNDGWVESHGNVIGRTWPSEDSAVPCWLYENLCYFVWKNRQLNKDYFEILVGEYEWQQTNSTQPIPENALIGGYRKNEQGSREVLYIGRTLFTMPSSDDAWLHMGHVEGNTRELVHSIWDGIQRKSSYQILLIKN